MVKGGTMAKPFPQSVIDEAWTRAGGKCECRENCHSAYNRCNKQLDPNNKESGKQWEAHHINSNGEPVLSNCKILCVSCHEKTGSYGR